MEVCLVYSRSLVLGNLFVSFSVPVIEVCYASVIPFSDANLSNHALQASL